LNAVCGLGTSERTHPIQYFGRSRLSQRGDDLDLTAPYRSDFRFEGEGDGDFGQDVKWNLDLLAGYRSVFLGDAARTREPGGFWSLIAPQVWNELRSGRYDVLRLH
jgi:hypothetical protein